MILICIGGAVFLLAFLFTLPSVAVGDSDDSCAHPDRGTCDEHDTDTDAVVDPQDDCPSDPNKTEPGICGCGVPDTDTDEG
jgi:hypothetical protein